MRIWSSAGSTVIPIRVILEVILYLKVVLPFSLSDVPTTTDKLSDRLLVFRQFPLDLDPPKARLMRFSADLGRSYRLTKTMRFSFTSMFGNLDGLISKW